MNVVTYHKATWPTGDISFSLELAMVSAVCGDGTEHGFEQKVSATRDCSALHGGSMPDRPRCRVVERVQPRDGSGASEASLDHEGIGPHVRWRRAPPVRASQGSLLPRVTHIGIFGSCQVGDKVLVGVTALHEIYALAKREGE